MMKLTTSCYFSTFNLASLPSITSIKYNTLFVSKLRLEQHINDKINKAYIMLGIIKRNFRSLDSYIYYFMQKLLLGAS